MMNSMGMEIQMIAVPDALVGNLSRHRSPALQAMTAHTTAVHDCDGAHSLHP